MKKTEQQEKLILSENAQSQLVVKSNALIQKTRFNLNLEEQKLILYIVSKIKPTDNEFEMYELEVKDICTILGITDHNNNIEYLKQSLKALRDKSFWVKLPNGTESLCSWLNKAKVETHNKKVQIRLDEDLKPYLLHLKSNYTSYELGYTLTFKSKYSIRLYELLKSWCYKEQCEISIQELRIMLNAENLYSEFKEFKRRILDTALKEINANSDIYVEYTPVRKGRFIDSLVFSIDKIVDENLREYEVKKRNEKLRSKDLEGDEHE